MTLRERLDWLLKSFENNKEGASSRKLSVFVIMSCVVYMHIVYLDDKNCFNFLLADLTFVLMVYNLISENGLINIFGSKVTKTEEKVTETTTKGVKETVVKTAEETVKG